MDSANTKSNIQKKMLVYARDIALDKLNKKLEKKIAKHQIRKKQDESALYERSSEDSDLIRTSSEFASSSSEIIPLVHSNEKLATSTSSNDSETKLLNRKSGVIAQSVASINSSGQEENYETADEDEDEEIPKKNELLETGTKPSELSEIPNTNDFIVEIGDDKNDKLVVKPNSAQAHSPSNSSGSVDYSGYIQKKSLAQGMMDLALVSANTNQLRYIIEYKDHHPYFLTSLSLVIASLFLQLAVGMTLIWNTKFNVKKRKEMQEADKVNNFSVVGIFIVTLINVFLSTFGGAPQPGAFGGGGSGSGGGGTEETKIPTIMQPDETPVPADASNILH